MILTRVTISGADESVGPSELLSVSREFPFVEWGILYSESRSGVAVRYPGLNWRRSLALEAKYWPMRLSLHLCGDVSRQLMAGVDLLQLGVDALPFQRIQLNGFSDNFLFDTVLAANPGWEFICQCKDRAALDKAADLAARLKNVSALYDPSGGRGIEASPWGEPVGRLRIGTAGGIGPDNVMCVLGIMTSLPGDGEFWIDMESKVRDSHERFDLGKARAVLAVARSFVKREELRRG